MQVFQGVRHPPAQPLPRHRLVYIRVSNMAMRRPRSGVIEFGGLAVGGRIMKMLRREQLFAAPKLVKLGRGTAGAGHCGREGSPGAGDRNCAVSRAAETAPYRATPTPP